MLPMIRVDRKSRWLGFGMVALAGLFAGALLSRPLWSSAADGGSVDERQAGDPRIVTVADLSATEEQVYRIAYDQAGDLWFVGARSDGQFSLNHIPPDGGPLERWLLPGKASPGPSTFLVEAGDGSWWVAANYSLWRFDPRTAQTLVALALDVSHPLQTEGATERGAPLPGTWVNGLLPTEDAVFLTRNNVRGLFQVLENGESALAEELAYAPAGLASVDGRPVAFASPAQMGIETAASSSSDDLALAYAETQDCSVTLSPAEASATVAGAAGTFSLGGLPARAGDMVAVGSGGGFAITLQEQPAILLGDCGMGDVESLALPGGTVGSDPRLRGGHQLQNLPPETGTRIEVVAIAVGPSGQVAFSDSTMRVFTVD